MNNFLQKLIIAGLFATLLIPLIVTESLFFPYITGKAFFFRVVTEIIFFAWLLLALRQGQYLPRKSWITVAILSFTVVVGIADFFGVNPSKAIWSNYERMEGFVTILHLAGYFLVASSVLSSRLWARFWNTGIGISVILCLYGLLQLAGVFVINQGGLRLDATLGNAIYFAGYLLVNIFIALFMLVRTEKVAAKCMYGGAIILQIVMLYYTATRGAMLGLIGGLLLAALLNLFFGKEWNLVRKASLGVVGLVALTIAAFFIFRDSAFVRSDPVLSRFATISFSETRTQARGYIWPMAIEGFKERPILGWGQEGFNVVFNKHYNPEMDQEQWFDRTHNVLLDWLIAAGLLGALLYMSIYAAVIFRLWKSETFTFAEKSILIGLFAAYFFHNMFVFDNLVSYLFFFSFCAYVHSSSKGGAIEAPRFIQNDVMQKILPGASVALLIIVLYFVNWPAFAANRTLIKAIHPHQTSVAGNLELFRKALSYESLGNQEIREQLFYRAIQIGQAPLSQAEKNLFLEFTKTELDKQIAAAPKDARAYYFQGSFLEGFGLFKESVAYLEKALSLSPKKQLIMYVLGESYLNAGDPKKAIEILKYAYELDPDNIKSAKVYGLTALYAGHPGAEELLKKAYVPKRIWGDNRLVYDVDLARVYFNLKNYRKAIDIWNVIIANEPKDVNNYIDLANAYIQIGNREKALETLRKALAANPEMKAQIDPLIERVNKP